VPEGCLLFSITSKQTARLGIINTSSHAVSLTITNSEGESFYSKNVSGKQNFFQLLDLSKMPGGEYAVRLTGLEKVCGKKFIIANSVAQLIKEETESEPTFLLQEDDILMVSYDNSKNYAVSIILEKENEIIFEDRKLSDAKLQKRYSLKNLPGGKYIIKLIADEKTFRFEINLTKE
jgi:hypothetical protein